MESETFWVIVVAGILILAPLYGYWMGSVGKRRSWNARKLGQVLNVTLVLAVVGGGLQASDIPKTQAPIGVRLAVFAAVYGCTFLTAFLAAAKSSGIPMRTLLSSRRPDPGNGLRGKSDLSIR